MTEATPANVVSELGQLAEGRIDRPTLEMFADGLDIGQFTDDDGNLDRSKLTAFADRVFPKPKGKGRTTGQSSAAGRDEARRRFGDDRTTLPSGGG